MPHLLIVLLAGAACLYVGYKYILRQRVKQAKSAENAVKSAGPDDRGKLIWDEQTKSYRPPDV